MKYNVFLAIALSMLSGTEGQRRGRNTDMALCKVENYEDCTILKDVGRKCRKCAPAGLEGVRIQYQRG